MGKMKGPRPKEDPLLKARREAQRKAEDRVKALRRAGHKSGKKLKLAMRELRKFRHSPQADRLAKEARFWRNYKSALAIGYDKPINQQAAKVLKH